MSNAVNSMPFAPLVPRFTIADLLQELASTAKPIDSLLSLKYFYKSYGFILFDKIMSAQTCDAIISLYDEHHDDNYAPILNLDRRYSWLQEIVMKNRIVKILIEHLTESPMQGCQTFFFFKKPGTQYGNQEFVPHQDNSYPRAEEGAYLAVDISLCDQNKESGGICLWLGTHKLGLLPFVERTGYREAAGEKPGNSVILPDGIGLEGAEYWTNDLRPLAWRIYRKFDVQLRRGQMLIFDGNLIHASYANHSNRSRPSIITNYIKAGADMISGRTAKRLRIDL